MDTHEFREVGHRMVDLLSEYLGHIEERPLFADVEPAKLNKLFAEPLPQNPSSSDEVLQQIQEKLLPYCTHVGHPGYFGLITPRSLALTASRPPLDLAAWVKSIAPAMRGSWCWRRSWCRRRSWCWR